MNLSCSNLFELLFFSLVFDWLHGWEQKDFLNSHLIGQKHDSSVNT